jgi:hypothetical protein
LIPISFLIASLSARAAEVGGARVVGMGDADIAAADDNAAITASPGVLGLQERYDFSGMFRAGPTGDLQWGAAIMDSHTTPSVAFGLAYVGGITDPPIGSDELPGWKLADGDVSDLRHDNQFTASIAAPLWERRISIGLSGDLLFYHRDVTGSGTTGNLALGAGFAPFPALVIGLVGRDLIPVHGPATVPATVGVGVRGIEKKWGAVEADGVWHPEVHAFDVSGGLEAKLGYARVRVGARSLGALDERQLTWGLGAEGESASFEYGMVIPVGPAFSTNALEHVVSLRVGAPDLDKEPEPTGF